MSKLILVRGIPGSGKSTYAKNLNILNFENDMFRVADGVYDYYKFSKRDVRKNCFEFTEHAMRRGIDVSVSNTFTLFKDMIPFLISAKHFKTAVEIVTLRTLYTNTHGLDSHTVSLFKDNFQDFGNLHNTIDRFNVVFVESTDGLGVHTWGDFSMNMSMIGSELYIKI